jgi:hypothetical protein
MEQSMSEVGASFGARVPRVAVVWSAFAAASALAVGLLVAVAPRTPAHGERAESARTEAPLGGLAGSTVVERPTLAPRDAPLERSRWTAIVVHDSGSPAGDPAALDRRHARAGLAGLGFHFVIGNGQGMDDGAVVAGYRWDRQLPGAHAARGMAMRTAGGSALDAEALNRTAIAICLVGNAERRAPSDAQMRSLAELLRSLQADLGIPANAVRFRSELGAAGGRAGCFPLDRFRAALLR